MTGRHLVEQILRIEISVARVVGIFTADPELGQLWRAGAALTEAIRFVELEDIRLTVADLA